jgi:hypothetical protein
VPVVWSQKCEASLARMSLESSRVSGRNEPMVASRTSSEIAHLSWSAVAPPVNASEAGSSEIAARTFESLAGVGAGGFEPP